MLRLTLAPLAVAVVLVGTACGAGGDKEVTSTTRTPDRYGALYQGLCHTAARAGDVGAARRAFFDEAHQPLHELATATAAVDRPAAARLLEAKEAVEHDLDVEGPALREELDRLLQASRGAIAATREPAPAPCQETP